ncbi:hypothetical protein [Intrasporangium sp. YIM S08009]|uniref:hypothetical protein n=1 Tax=Intrasporangium zincisolvens TaxID=3080018 RepID=UPI002B05A1C6|nr:hypothetical protein [Intrasporangium sp. YIM S08009]
MHGARAHEWSRWREASRRRAAVAGLVTLLAVGGCTGRQCSFDACPDVPPERAGRVTGVDASGTVRWSTTIADLVSRSPTVGNGYVVIEGCHAPHVVQVATGAVSTPEHMTEVLGVVAGQVVGFPDDDAMLVAEPVAGGPGGFSWTESPDDPGARNAYRSSAVLTDTSVLGVLGRTLVVWTPGTGGWERTEVALPVGAQRGERLVVADPHHVVVPGDDGSLLGVDLTARRVTWRTLPPRPDDPVYQHVELDGTAVTVVTGYRTTDAPAVTGGEGIDYVGWRVDARTGRTIGQPTHSTPRKGSGDDIATTVRDPTSGWSVTQRLERQPRGGCF